MIEWIVSSCVLILAVILVRAAFRNKLRAWVRYSLWALVLVRLLIPFSIGSSLLSTGNIVEEVKQQPAIQSVTDRLTKPNISYEQAYDQAVQDFLQSGQTITPERPVPDYTAPNYKPQTPLEQHTQQILEKATPAVKLETVLLWVWISGMGITAGCFLFSNCKLQRYLKKNRVTLENYSANLRVYTCHGLDTPCLFGLLRPSVYLLPEEAAEETVKRHILCHELTHYRHLDHIWSTLRCLCLVLHWYNPLVWVAAILSRRDAELACDEATIRKLGEDQRHSYGKTLIEMTCARRPGAGLMNTATTMTGSKAAIKERVTMIAKKPKFSIIALALALVIAVLAVGCAFSGTKQTVNIQEVQLSAEQKAEIEKGWAEYLSDKNFKAALTFCNLENKQDGIRYYGTYKLSEDGPENHIFFIPCTDSDVPSQYSPDGIRFTHRAPFVLVEYTAMDLGGKVFHYFGRISPNAYAILPNALELHEAYEKQLYGSVLKEVEIPNDQSGLIEAENTMLAFMGIRQNMIRPDKKYNDVFLGKYDGYLTVMFRSGTHAAMIMETEIGEYTFCYGSSFSLLAIKDGAFYNLKDLYEDGNISEESVAEIEAKYYEFFPEWRDPLSNPDSPKPSTSPTEPEGRRDLTAQEIQSVNAFFSDKHTADPVAKKFFTSFYDSAADIDLASFVIGFPTEEELTDEAEYAKLWQLPDFPCPKAMTLAQCPTVFRKVKATDIDAALQKYAGITLKETNMRWDSFIDPLLYLEEYDAFYYDASFGIPGSFRCTSGWIEDDTVVLYRGFSNQFTETILRKTDTGWKIASNQHYFIPPKSIYIDPEGAIQDPTVMVNGWLYVFAESEYYDSIPDGYNLFGQVAAQDNNTLPTQELHAAQLPVGTEIYTSPTNNGVDLLVMLSDGGIHRFHRSEATQPTPEGAPLAFFQDLLQNSYWHNAIAGHTFDSPEKASIYCIFSSGTPEDKPPLTDAEKRFLREETQYTGDTDYQKLPAATFDNVLQRYLGISLEESEKEGFGSFRYYAETDVYFSFFNGSERLGNAFQVYNVEKVNDCYVVSYINYYKYQITLRLVDGEYQILSNVEI